MKLSVCLIARNEESRLEAAVDSVRAVADEIVITDTGSTDGTVALAKRLGARVSHFDWCDDFAAARNACQQHAQGDWIFWLDADERLKPGSADAVRAAIRDPLAIAHQVIREDYFSTERTDWFSEMYQMRLVLRALPCRFVGRIHEHLDPDPVALATKTGRTATVSGVRIQHWGYTNDRLPDKVLRAAALCELELRERPGQLYYLVELARALLTIRTPETHAKGMHFLGEAAAILQTHRNDPMPPSPMAASLIEQLLALPSQTWISIDDLIKLTARWFPRSAPLSWAISRTFALREEWPQAEYELRRLVQMIDARSYDRYMSFDPRVGEDARFNLGVCLVRQAKLDEAESVFTELLASQRRAGEARANLEAVRGLKARFASE